jgi:putative endopeptidase
MTPNRPLLAALLIALAAPWPAAAADALFDPANLDAATPACTDFFRHAAGGWIAHNPIPASESGWERLAERGARNREVLRNLLTAAAARTGAPAESVEGKVGAFYASCMDEAAIEARGLDPIRPELDRIAAVSDLPSLQSAATRLQILGVNVPFVAKPTADRRDSSRMILEIRQGGLGLPDRDYYFKGDEATKKVRGEYVGHVARMLELAGEPPEDAARDAAAVMTLETRLAGASKTRAERRNVEANYHKMTLAEMGALTPHLSWERWLHDTGIGREAVANVIVQAPDFMKVLDQQLATVSLADWKAYLRWHFLRATGEWLPERFAKEHFRFAQGVLLGIREARPRWDLCVRSTDHHLGMALGRLYAEKAFPPEAKKRAQAMVDQILAALRDDLPTLAWMDEATRAAARRKLDAITTKIGYPDHWLDYTGLAVDRASYAANVLRADEREVRRRLGQVGKPVDRTEWSITPSTVNAYYEPSLNEIVFPAGILQPPFFDAAADDAYNFGAAGSMIGHELSHGFDDQGAQFDGAGNLKNWWSPADLASFRKRAECVEKQFDGYTLQGLPVNGKLVEGEAIADLGGVKLAYNAYQRVLQGKPRQTLDGYTPEQRFFLGLAQIWAGHQRPEAERLRVATNPHPANRFRVDGSVSNLPEFAQAFGCKPGDPMVRPAEERCAVW